MTTKKLFFTVLSLGLIGILSFGTAAFAIDDYRSGIQDQGDAFVGLNGANFGEPTDARIVVALLIRYALGVVGTLFLAYGVYAGYIIMASAGEEEKITRAKSTLRTCIIGLIVILSAYSLTVLASSIFDLTQEPSDNYINVDIDSTNNNRVRNPRPQDLY